MSNITLDKNFHILLPFDMVFNYPHTEGYDPVKVIKEFWKTYDVNTSRDHIVSLLLKSMKKDLTGKDYDISTEDLNKFSLELMHLLTAYYLCHIHNIELSELDIPNMTKGTISEEELKFRQINYALFGSK